MQQQPQNPILKILFARHGQTQHNKTRTIAGHQPGKLTPTGRAQAEKIGIYLQKNKKVFDYVYVSDLGRTKETYQCAVSQCKDLGKVGVVFTGLVRERSGGILEGKPLNTWEQNAKKQGVNIRAYKCQGAQSWLDVNKRATKFLQTLIETHLLNPTLNPNSKPNPQTKILVITHGGFIMQFINVYNRIHGKQEKFQNSAKNCSMHQFEVTYPGTGEYLEEKVGIRYVLENFVGHL